MANHSMRNRRRMQQSGLGDALRVVLRLPNLARQLPNAPELDAEMEFRLRSIEHARKHGADRGRSTAAGASPDHGPPPLEG